MRKYKITFIHLLALTLTVSFMTSLVAMPTARPSPKDRVVMLETGNSSCTGVILQTNLILTCAHCIKTTITYNGNPATVVKIDHEADLALLSVKTPVMERITLAECQISDDVYTYGHPMGEPTLYFSKGYVMNVQDKTIMTSLITLPGDSGSPLFSKDSSLLGLIDGGISANGADFPISTTIPSSTIKKFLNW